MPDDVWERPPNDDEAMDIAMKIYQFADLAAHGNADAAVDAIREWVGDGELARLHSHYIAATAPLIAMGLMRNHFPVDKGPDDFWIMERLPGCDVDVHREALAQVLVRRLNEEHDTALDLLDAHINTYGDEGLFWFGVEAIVLLAGVIRSVNEQESADA